ncbi:MAG: hypothetical protein INQ03_10850 [Candidatus Heimdallarchaeota archaeon]|nr:hypothetical protein [Candidatus Heimdallarchaeota archaeon]
MSIYIDNTISFFKNLKWHHWLQILIGAHIVFFPSWGEKIGYDLSGVGDSFIRGLYTRFPLILPIMIPIRMRMGKNDYRFKMLVHLLYLVILIFLESYISNNGIPPTSTHNFLILSLPIVVLVLVTFISMLEVNKPFIKEFEEYTENVIGGNVNHRITNDAVLTDSVFGPIGTFFNSIMDSLVEAFKGFTEMNDLIVNTSQNLASSSEEISASASEVSGTSSSMAHGASQQAEMISKIASQMNETNIVIQDIVSQIRKNTDTVSSISLQTNILALNAGIEASRAGDYGRGFNVVADNVRKLSDESKKSAENIEEVVNTITITLQSLFDNIQGGIEQVASVSEETAASSEEVAAAAEEMIASIAELADVSSKLVTQVKHSRDSMFTFLQK